MTDETELPVEEIEDAARTVTDRVQVAGGDLVKTVQSLLREAAVRRITVQDKTGRTLIELPLYAGVVGALLAGAWTVLALIAAWFAEVSILIEREATDEDKEASVVGEAVDRATHVLSNRAASVAASAKAGVGGAFGGALGSAAAAVGGAAHAAGEMARRAADSVEERMAAGQKAAEAIIEAAEAADPDRCVALTKSGERCKRNAVAGSNYCSTHQPK